MKYVFLFEHVDFEIVFECSKKVGGIYHSNKKETSSESFHGMSLTQMKENFPIVILPNQNAVSDFAVDVAANQSQIDENGWFVFEFLLKNSLFYFHFSKKGGRKIDLVKLIMKQLVNFVNFEF